MSKTNNNNLKLEQNGRVFPSWIMKNFKKYVLPEVIRKEGEDPCNEAIEKGKLTTYQKFIGEYLNQKILYKISSVSFLLMGSFYLYKGFIENN